MPFDSTNFIEIESNTTQKLRMMREIIGTPDRWIKGVAWATDRVAYCLIGAKWAAASILGMEERAVCSGDILHKLTTMRGFEDVESFNDAPETTHADVLALLDEAIELSKA